MIWRKGAAGFSDGADSGSSTRRTRSTNQDHQDTRDDGADLFPEIRKVTSPRYESDSEFRGQSRKSFDPYQDSYDMEDFEETTAFTEHGGNYNNQYSGAHEDYVNANDQETVRFDDTIRHEPTRRFEDMRSARSEGYSEPAELSDSGKILTQERVIAQMHSHPFRLTLPALITIAAAGATAYLFGFFEENWENWAVLISGIIVVLLFGLLPLLFWLGTNYTVTTRRVIIRRGFLTQIRQELLHSRNYDVTVRRGPLQRMIGSGDVLINVGLEMPVTVKNIQDPILVQNVLQELMERSASTVSARRQRGAASGR